VTGWQVIGKFDIYLRGGGLIFQTPRLEFSGKPKLCAKNYFVLEKTFLPMSPGHLAFLFKIP